MTRVERAVPRLTRWTAPPAAAILVCAVAAVAVAATRPATVTTHQTSKGKVLAAAAGHTLYLFAADKKGKSSCYGSCTRTWTPDSGSVSTAGPSPNWSIVKRPSNSAATPAARPS